MGQVKPLELRNGVAVITGAAGGIGAALALQMAQRGCHLALADVRATELEATASQARALGVTVSTHVLDMAQPTSAAELLQAVQAAHGRATVLVNNAGVALVGHFEQLAEADFDWLMAINFGAVVRLTRAFLPLLARAPAAQVVNISSLFGLIALPGQSAYCAAKFAVRGFSEALRHELEDSGSPVGMTIVHPGGVRTGIGANARLPAKATAEDKAEHEHRWRMALQLPPDVVATRILQGIVRREPRVLVGKDALVASWLQRLFPQRYWHIMAPGLQRRLARPGQAAPADHPSHGRASDRNNT